MPRLQQHLRNIRPLPDLRSPHPDKREGKIHKSLLFLLQLQHRHPEDNPELQEQCRPGAKRGSGHQDQN